MPDASTSEELQTKKNKWQGKNPRSSKDINEAVLGSGYVKSETQSGDHRTFRIVLPNGQKETLTVIQGGKDLKDTNPKVWYKLIKTLRNWGIITLLAAGGTTLIASQLGNIVK